MNNYISRNIKNKFIRVVLVLAMLLAILAGPLSTPAYAQTSTMDLVLGGEGATGWTINNIQPGDTGTKTVTLRNNSSVRGTIRIWIDNITESDGNSDGAALDNYLYFNLSQSTLITNIILPTKIRQLPQSATDTNYIKISSIAAGATITLNWRWLFQETGTPQNDAQGDNLTFSIKYMLIEEELYPDIVISTPEPTQQPEPTPTGDPIGLMVNTIKDRVSVGTGASATNTKGEQLTIVGSLITIEKETEIGLYVNIPVALPEGETLSTYTDSHGTTFSDNKLVFSSFDNNNKLEVTVTINTDNATGKGNSAKAKIKNMFLDVVEKSIDLSSIAPSLGEVAASVNATLNSIPVNAIIHSTITKTLRPDVQTAYELATVDTNCTVDNIAYAMEIEKANLENGKILGEARITMKVGAAYVEEHGIENIRICRYDDEIGQLEILETEFLGYDSAGKAIFMGISPHGLSVFILTAASQPTEPTVVPLTVTPATGETQTITIDILGKITAVKTDTSGKLLETVQATDPDGKIILSLSSGSTIMSSDGKVPQKLKIDRVQITPPEDILVLEGIYQLQAYLYAYSDNPTAFTISSSGVLTLSYQKEDLPSGTLSVFLTYYDSQYGWIRLPPAGVAQQGNLSMSLKGPAIFSMMLELGTPTILEPFFRVSNLVIEPEETRTGEEITASVIVTNIGAVAGTFTLELKLDGIAINEIPISLESNENRVVNFNFEIDSTGIHIVEVTGLKGKVSITASRNLLPFALASILPIIIILEYRKRRNTKDDWTTGLKTKHWLVDE